MVTMEANDIDGKKKRNRPSLVCVVCKKRKIKCDKGKPCSQCVKKHIEGSCVYEDIPITSRRSKKSRHNNHIPILNPKDSGCFDEIHVGSYNESNPNPPPILAAITAVSTSGTTFTDGTSKPSKVDSSLVLVSKTELEELRAKAQKYTLGLISPGHSDSSDDYFNTSSAPTSVSSDGSSETYYSNRFVPSETLKVFQCHDSKLPGHIVDRELSSRNHMFTSGLPSGKVRKLTLKEIQVPTTNAQSVSVYGLGINPYDNPSDVINFYANYDPVFMKGNRRRMNIGPLAWGSIQRKDHTLSLLKEYTKTRPFKEIFDSKRKPISIPNCRLVPIPADEHKSTLNLDGSQIKNFEKKILDEDDETIQYDIKSEKQSSENTDSEPTNNGTTQKIDHGSNFVKKFVDDRNITLGLTVLDGGKLDRELKLIEKIQVMMPKRKVIWILAKRFFRMIYPLYPYIDEFEFRHHIENIVGPESVFDESIPTVQVKQKRDFAYLGVLFIVLRLSYLSLFFNRSSINESILKETENLTVEEEERKFLLLNPINISAIELAQSCLHQFHLMGKLSMPIMTLAIWIRIYHRIAPEEGEGLDGGDFQIYNGMLIQMAYSMGLNREPQKDLENEKANNLGRKIWYFLCANDSIGAFTYGNPLTTNTMYYDTKLPFYTEENTNLQDQELERATITLFKYSEALVKGPMKDLLSCILDVNNKVPISEFTHHLNHFECAIRGVYGTVHDYINRLESTDVTYHSGKIMKASCLISLNAFFVSMYFHLFNHYEKKKNFELSYFYLTKLMAITIGEMIPCFLPLIVRSQEIFGEGADLIVNPPLIQSIQRACEMIVISLVKFNLWIYKACLTPDHKIKYSTDIKYRTYFESMCSYVAILEKFAKLSLVGATVMSGRYYYAWAISKIHGFFMKIVNEEEFYIAHKDTELYFNPPTLDQLDELYKIGETGINTIRARANKTCEDFKAMYTIDPNQRPAILKNFDESYFHVPDGDIVYSRGVSVNAEVTPVSDTSNEILYEELIVDDLPQIDSAWLQMLNQKTTTGEYSHTSNPNANPANSNPNYMNDSDVPNSYNFSSGSSGSGISSNSAELNSSTQESTPSQTMPFGFNGQTTENLTIDNFGGIYDFSDNHFDFFSDLPLEKLFK
ncbi:fungal transcriptional regulatory protein [Scheffersomyces amazonensis]|uniref:fungal transcriptional regulatory protein n=1 Tax=Scheffersomyces amazonensis TaxID=1078765 RepID=UPI00315D3C11